jgi:ankyrin repeat protein
MYIHIMHHSLPVCMQRDGSALHVASVKGYRAAVKALIQCGADVNMQRGNGFTPLWFAAEGEHIAAGSLLLEAGADPRWGPPGVRKIYCDAVNRVHATTSRLLHDHLTTTLPLCIIIAPSSAIAYILLKGHIISSSMKRAFRLGTL